MYINLWFGRLNYAIKRWNNKMPKSLFKSVCQQILPLFLKLILRKKQEFWVKTSSYVSIFFPKKTNFS